MKNGQSHSEVSCKFDTQSKPQFWDQKHQYLVKRMWLWKNEQ